MALFASRDLSEWTMIWKSCKKVLFEKKRGHLKNEIFKVWRLLALMMSSGFKFKVDLEWRVFSFRDWKKNAARCYFHFRFRILSLSLSLTHSYSHILTHTHSLTQFRQQHNFLKMSVFIKMEIDDGDKFNKFDDLKVFGLMIVDTQWPIFWSDLTLNPS